MEHFKFKTTLVLMTEGTSTAGGFVMILPVVRGFLETGVLGSAAVSSVDLAFLDAVAFFLGASFTATAASVASTMIFVDGFLDGIMRIAS